MITNTIDLLLVNEDIKKTLKKIETMTRLEESSKSNIVPSIFLIADRGCGVSSLGKVYSGIIDNSVLMGIRGSETFIELVFPKDNPQDENLFFSSPQRAASIRNRFYGTMLISFEEFEGQDLLKSESFIKLLHFVESNKENIYFIFRILPEYSTKRQLKAHLRKIVNIVEITMNKPDVKMACDYVISELKEKGLVLTNESRNLLEGKVFDVIVKADSYEGYKSLDKLISEIEYELAYAGNTDKLITDSIIEAVVEKCIDDYMTKDTRTRIGFGM